MTELFSIPNKSSSSSSNKNNNKKMDQKKTHHFLLVSYGAQSHINPVLNLAHRLTTAGVHVTFSTTVFAHRLMFPNKPIFPLFDPNDHLLCYHPVSDGFDDGVDRTKSFEKECLLSFKDAGSRCLRAIASAPATGDRPAVTFIVYSFYLPWACEVARELGLQSACFWIQPVALFSVYYHFFRGYKDLVLTHSKDSSFSLDLPGLLPLKIRDLPPFLLESDGGVFSDILSRFEEVFDVLDREIDGGGTEMRRPVVLVNSSECLELDALVPLRKVFELVPIGPLLPSPKRELSTADIIKHSDDKAKYMEWLDGWPEKSVVYLSFGSFELMSKKQNAEISQALAESVRPYFRVSRGQLEEDVLNGAKGMTVGWCSQVEVLSHKSIGCFVTHCGWNSTLESLACGVPMVAVPQWFDQMTNARLVEGLWKIGVRAVVDEEEGVVKGSELRRCLDLVMDGGEKGEEIRRNARIWKGKTTEAVLDGGSSYSNLTALMEDVGLSKKSNGRGFTSEDNDVE